MTRKGRSAEQIHQQMKQQQHNRLTLITRAEEALAYLKDHDGHTDLSKSEFAEALAEEFGYKYWTVNGEPDRRLVEAICNLTRDQDDDPFTRKMLGGMVVAYAPSLGGMTLFDLMSGEMPLEYSVHFLAGEMQRQQAAKTINRRRIAVFKAAAQQAMQQRRFELGRLLSQCENEVNTTGFVSDSLYAEFLKIVMKR